ncbi:MAG: sigma-70 family RNA polymerase sigma factor [Gemmatimonadetes bacterium]|nr:sigma-70 family RNA polymerase sigma factor [Gemmatimonadota bacterium]
MAVLPSDPRPPVPKSGLLPQSSEIDFDGLFALCYDELREIARRHLRHERSGHTLVATALVHEAYIKLANRPEVEWGESVRFRAFVSKAMRHVLVDHARGRNTRKRGGEVIHVTLQPGLVAAEQPSIDLIEFDDALCQLATLDPRLVQVVECRCFGGLGLQDTAAALGVSSRTVERDWTRAKAYLRQLLAGDPRLD